MKSNYTIRDYAAIIADTSRIEAYTEALRKLITPASIVLDLGAGTGIFSLIACKLGAKRVFAIELNPAIQLGPQLAKDNGFEDRITFFESNSLDITLAERVDIIVSDIRGVLPLYRNSLEIFGDAVTRFLKPDGAVLPERDILKAVLVEGEDQYVEATAPFRANTYELDLSVFHHPLSNAWLRSTVENVSLLSEIEIWHEICYRDRQSADVSNTLSFKLNSSGIAHGFYLWFDTQLCDEIGYSSGPGSNVSSYGSMFFPLSQPVPVVPQSKVKIELQARLIDDEYLWRWDSQIVTAGEVFSFQQSTFFGDLIPSAQLKT